MTNESLIHVKLEYEEALQSKKDILFSELQILKILKFVKRYHLLRSEELRLKIKLARDLRSLTNNLKTFQLLLPKVRIPEILKEEKEKIPRIKIPEDESLESQLNEIEERLRAISR